MYFTYMYWAKGGQGTFVFNGDTFDSESLAIPVKKELFISVHRSASACI